MDDTAESVEKLQKTLLSWNYVDLCREMDEGRGLGGQLSKVPTGFSSVEVRHSQQGVSACKRSWQMMSFPMFLG